MRRSTLSAIAGVRNALLKNEVKEVADNVESFETATNKLTDDLYALNKANDIIDLATISKIAAVFA
jgi:hypothetical protein